MKNSSSAFPFYVYSLLSIFLGWQSRHGITMTHDVGIKVGSEAEKLRLMLL